MKGDIAVAGFMMTAEEWQELDPQSRSELVAVITRRDEPRLARGSGEFAVVGDEPTTETLSALAACKAT
ncbi:MAG TPA: hypothetical protein VGM90_36075 [Kofleriaceae bacterium]|jgi:hypothetical protein